LRQPGHSFATKECVPDNSSTRDELQSCLKSRDQQFTSDTVKPPLDTTLSVCSTLHETT